MIKYCVAHVYVYESGVAISYYAFEKGYGLHLTDNPEDPSILWYSTAVEAARHILNDTNECVLPKIFE